jgi:translation elongation factor EF-1alpha
MVHNYENSVGNRHSRQGDNQTFSHSWAVSKLKLNKERGTTTFNAKNEKQFLTVNLYLILWGYQ